MAYPSWMIDIAVILASLLIGSFLNVLIYRLPRGESIVSPGSHCPHCDHPLGVLDLIPVLSYIFSAGQCRYCKGSISSRYPLVETLTAILFWLVYQQHGLGWPGLTGVILTAVLIVSMFTDIDEGIIPNAITYPAFVVVLCLSFVSPLGWLSSLIGGLGFFIFMLVIALVSKGGMGGGDVKLAAVIGAATGPAGAVMVLIISSLAGGLWGLFLIITRGAGGKSAIKFGPFLAVAAYAVWMWEQPLLNFYLGLMR